MLSGWEASGYSLIGAEYSLDQGEYYHPQLQSSINEWVISTESIYQMTEKGWSFYGEFEYRNFEADCGVWNLEYNLPTNGSPFYFMVQKDGWWKSQTYDFTVAVAKQLNDKLSIGSGVLYSGDMFYRMSDKRNNNTNLEIKVTPSVNYKIVDNHYIGAGVLFDRKKNEQYLYNKYTHGTDGAYYITYINQGLGTWYKDTDGLQLNEIEILYGGSVSWSYRNQNSYADVIYTLKTGKESWKYNYYSENSSDGSALFYYTLTSHEIAARYQHDTSYGRWVALLTGEMISGLGYVYNSTSLIYKQNYSTTLMNADLSAQLLPRSKVINRVEVSADLSSNDQLDSNYGQTVAYSNLLTSGEIDFGVLNRNDIEMSIGVKALYNMNLSATHNSMAAASNMYTTSVIIPALAYLSTSYYGGGAQMGIAFNAGNAGRMQINLTGQLIKPLAYNLYQSDATFSLTDNYLSAKLQLALYF